MAKRIVNFTQKDIDGDVKFIGNTDEDWSPLSIEQAIFDIEEKIHSYVVQGDDNVEVDIHVVNHPRGKYLRTNPDENFNNNLDEVDSDHSPFSPPLPDYLGNYPNNHRNDWNEKIQGVTHSLDYWFFTQLKVLYKFHISTDLKSDKDAAVITVNMPSDLSNIGCDHFGDPDYLEVNGQGYIFVPVEGSDGSECNSEPRLAVFRDDEQLTFIGSSLFPNQVSALGTSRAGWCAFSPIDNLLYSSHNKISEDFPVFRYQLDFDALELGSVQLQPESNLVLHDNGNAIKIDPYIQGGCFSPDGILYICSGKLFEDESKGGIRVFSPTGELIHKSSLSKNPFKYEYKAGLIHLQEPEGMTYWDIDSLPAGIDAPGINGQLHAILLNKAAGNDKIYFKHYKI